MACNISFDCNNVQPRSAFCFAVSSCPDSSSGTLLTPNRTFLVRFGGISGEFGRAMVRILARRSRAKIPMARPNEPDMPPKRTKKVRLGIYRTQIRI